MSYLDTYRKPFLGRYYCTNKVCSKVPRVIWSVHVILVDNGLEIRSCEVTFMMEHADGDIMGELFNLFFDVAEEGITEPASYHYSSEGDANSYEVHGHDDSGSDGVGANV